MTLETIAKEQRKAAGVVLYRGLITLLFLTALFDAFPEHTWALGLGVLVFNQGIGAIGTSIGLISQSHNYLNDAAERKTRHTVLLAQSNPLSTYPLDEIDFWEEVNRRVAAERAPEPEPPGAWAKIGTVAWSFGSLLLLDLGLIFLALVFAG